MKKLILIISLLVYLMLTANAQNLIQIKNINTNSSGSYPFDFTIAGNKLYFIAADNFGTYSLWFTNSSNSVTKKLSPASTTVSIPDIIAYNGKIYFAFDDGIHGYELWISDGTVAGTKLFKDLYPGSTGSYPQAFAVANNKLFFMGNGINGERRLYASDGTPAGTVIIRDDYIDVFEGLYGFPVLNNNIYFGSNDGTGDGLFCLWKSDGTTAGTQLVSCDVSPVGGGGCNYAVLNNKLYFGGADIIHGNELWTTDGTMAGTYLVKNINPDGGGAVGNGNPDNLKVYKNKIYFEARDDVHGIELFSTDGTTAGTKLVKDIAPGTTSSLPWESIVFNNLLYFVCFNTAELWQTNGTTAGTTLVKGGLLSPRIGNKWNNKIYLVVTDNYGVWQSDGTNAGTIPIKPDNTTDFVSSLNNGFQFSVFKNELYFSGQCNSITSGYELAKLSTTASKFAASTGNYQSLQLAKGNIDDDIIAAYNAAGKQITINNKSYKSFTWQLYSSIGNLISKGRSANIVTAIPASGIAAGTYFLVCTSAEKTEKTKLEIF